MTQRVNWAEARTISQKCAKHLTDVVMMTNRGQAYIMQCKDTALKQRWIKNLNEYREAAESIRAASTHIPRVNREVGVDEFPKYYEVTQTLNDRMMHLVEIVAEFHSMLELIEGKNK